MKEKLENNKSKKGKKIKIFILVILVIAAVALGLVFGRKKVASGSAGVQSYVVRSEVYENVIEVSGVVLAAQEQSLQALSSGTVVGVYAQQGDFVKKGDVILQMDDSNEQYSLAKHDYDMATVRISGSSRELELMQTQRKALLQKIAERKVTATFDGIIADIDVAVGDSVESKDSIGTLVDKNYLVADVEVTETDVAKLKVGQTVKFTFPAYDGTVEGYVVGWPAIGEVTSRGATIVKVKLRIDEYPETILPYFSFSGKIEISPSETYTLVNRLAVGREDGQAYVQNMRTGEKINVTVVPYDSEYVKIVEGDVKAGDVLAALSSGEKSGSARSMTRSSGGNTGSRSGGSAEGGFGGAGGAPAGGFGGGPGGF